MFAAVAMSSSAADPGVGPRSMSRSERSWELGGGAGGSSRDGGRGVPAVGAPEAGAGERGAVTPRAGKTKDGWSASRGSRRKSSAGSRTRLFEGRWRSSSWSTSASMGSTSNGVVSSPPGDDASWSGCVGPCSSLRRRSTARSRMSSDVEGGSSVTATRFLGDGSDASSVASSFRFVVAQRAARDNAPPRGPAPRRALVLVAPCQANIALSFRRARATRYRYRAGLESVARTSAQRVHSCARVPPTPYSSRGRECTPVQTPTPSWLDEQSAPRATTPW